MSGSTKREASASSRPPIASTKSENLDRCANCGEMIGALEAAYVHRDSAVCERCYNRLCVKTTTKSKTAFLIIVGAACLVAACIGSWFFIERAAPAKTDIQSADAIQAAGTAAIPAARAQTMTISGAAWLQKEDGDTSLQRGLTVQLLRPVISSSPVVETIRAAIPQWQQLAQGYRDMAKTVQQGIAQAGDTTGALAESEAGEIKTASDVDARVEKYENFVKTSPAQITIQSAYAILSNPPVSTEGKDSFEAVASSAVITDATTDVDGKYIIQGVAPGNYYIHASLETSLMFVEWLLPVQIQGDPVKLDLDNSNASVIKNFTH